MPQRSEQAGVSPNNEVETLLKRERDTAQRYLDVAGVILIAIDAEQRVTLINRKGCEITGYSDQELLGKNWFDTCVPASQREEVRTGFRQLMAGDLAPVEYFENSVLTRDGRERIVAWYNTLLRDDSGTIIGTLSSGNDITDRKMAEERLRLLSSVVEQTIEGIAVADLTGRLTYVNEALAAMCGYTREELVGRNLSICHTAEQMPLVEAANRQLLETGRFVGEIYHRRKDGTVFPTVMSNTILRDAPGAPIGMIASMRDISAQKQVEKALQESEAMYHDLVETSPNLVYRLDLEGRVTFVNRTCKEITGYEPEEIIGRRFTDFQTPEFAAQDLEVFGRHMAGEPINNFDTVFRAKSGCPLYFVINARVCRDANGVLVGSLGTAFDITERKHAEETLRQSEERYRTLYASMNEAVALHEVVYDSGRRPVDYRILDVNPSFERITGFSRERAVGRLGTELYECTPPPYLQTFAAVATSGKSATLEGRFDLLERQLRISVFSPELGKFATVFDDITDQVRARQELRVTHERLKATLDALPDLLFEVDRQGQIHDYRAPHPEILLLKPEEFLGRPVTELLPSEAAEVVMEAIREAATLGHSFGRVYPLDLPQSRGWFELSVASKGDPKSPDARFIALVRDVTQRKLAEDRLRLATSQLSVEREALAEKNIALKQILEHIERERQDYKQRICQEMEEVVAPVLRRLRERCGPERAHEIESLHENLNAMLARDVDVMKSRFARLTPREQEICDMIRNGMSSKEISEALKLSILTVHKHREQVREKLGLTNQNINLGTFLRTH